MSSILAYSENENLAGEVFTAANELSNQLECDAISLELDELRSAVKVQGKIVVLKSTEPLSNNSELTTAAITDFAKKKNVSIILLGGTRFGREVAAQIAARMRFPALSDVKDLRIEGGKLIGVRLVYAGKYTGKVGTELPCVATVQAGAYECGLGTPISVEKLDVNVPPTRITRLATKPKLKMGGNLSAATIIISAGRGFKKKEDLTIAQDLAKNLGGIIGCSRPLASDLGWMSEDRHIGLTGIHVHPNLYLAIGISGQLQHIAGVKGSKIIAAVNNDKQAPIFQFADYGIVGDLYEVVPVLTKLCLTDSAPN